MCASPSKAPAKTSPDHGGGHAAARRTYREARGSAFAAAAVVIAGQTWLANALALRPVWVLPLLSAGLLIGSVAVYDSASAEPSLASRWFARGVVIWLALVNAICLGLLVYGIFVRSALDPPGLLLAGVVLWVVNIAVFALAYWETDGGGPEDRDRGRGMPPDLVFPQQQPDQGELVEKGWKATFLDYLYVSLTASTAFSPTDAMPYSRSAKLLMGSESTISFAIIVMLIARAVNIAKG